jgi:hypothetical protein
MEPLQVAHRKYLRKRHYDPNELERKWGLQGTAHLSKDWNWRVVAPIKDAEGRVVAYTGRTLSKKLKPKWKTTSDEDMGCDPKKLIYGIDKVDTDRGVLIVEGPGDVWRMGYGAVALLGIDWKVDQACVLRSIKRRFIMFDPSPVAQKRAEELAYWLSPFPGETEIIYDLKSDPGALPQKEADNIMRTLGLLKRRRIRP